MPSSRLVLAVSALMSSPLWAASELAPVPSNYGVEEVKVWGEKRNSGDAGYTSPNSVLMPEDMLSINAATTEDLVKYEPSLVIRRRFIGDANGTLGIRGSNMFQTSRSMVFADGVPLHYFLQSRWNGAPRWTMVSASEIAQLEVLYGPFSAEYSGNAMGGVVLIETAIPQQQELHIDVGYFRQDFNAYGFDDSVDGYKTFISYGDKQGALSYYLSYNHLQNDSQPQSFYYGGASSSPGATPVTGAIAGNDERGNSQLFFGDTGIVDTGTDNFKLKLGYEMGEWLVLANIAFEDRMSYSDAPNSYVRDANGDVVWAGDVEQNGERFSIPASRLSVSEAERQSLSLGLRLKGPLTDSIHFEGNINQFEILKDQTRSSAVNPNNPAFDGSGQVVDYGDTGWQTLEAKLAFNEVGVDGMSVLTGLRYEAYELNTQVFSSSNYAAGQKDNAVDASGGETSLAAAFVQMNWDFAPAWDLSLGGRFESWRSRSGYYADDNVATPGLDLVDVPGREDESFSPKFALGFQPAEQWQLRYAIARAYRYPIVEELFSQFEAFNSLSEANPELKPEKGLHHNLMIERGLESGYVRVNVFRETIQDVIESQSTTLPGGGSVRTFVPVDVVETQGVELIVNAYNFMLPNLDLRFNLAWTDAEITKNRADPSIEGNQFTRMPKWRGNVLLTYHVSEKLDVGGSVQYASDSYGRLDNADREDNVFSAQDAYLRLGFKSSYQFTPQIRGSIGIDNLLNDIDYVAHPWPGRTFYVNLSYDL